MGRWIARAQLRIPVVKGHVGWPGHEDATAPKIAVKVFRLEALSVVNVPADLLVLGILASQEDDRLDDWV